MQRRLAAILVADVVGYSKLMAADEDGTHARLKALRVNFIDPKITEHGGRTFKEVGDGLLVEFPSVVNAVRCGIEIQEAVGRHNSGGASSPIEYRIGIHLGDVIVEGDDLIGDGVNIAARLEGVAVPGGIAVSDDVRRQTVAKLQLEFEDTGERQLKNIASPIRVFVLKAKGMRVGPPLNILERPAVAVLPFVNMSGDPEQDYFADGLTEDIITALSYWRSFPVIARNSTFAYKGVAVDVRTVARDLNARFILEGSVRKAGQRIRISAQLIDATTGHHVWAEKYDRQLIDVFELQDEITKSIAAVTEPAITRAEAIRLSAPGTRNIGAWDYYLRGLSLMHRFTPDAHREAREMFARALEFDPTYSQAHVGIAQTYLQEIFLKQVEDHDDAVAQVMKSAEVAVRLDDSDSSAHMCRGLGFMWSGMHDRAVDEVRRATECNPSNAMAHIILGNVLDVAGYPAEGIGSLEVGLKLNPMEPMMHYAMTWLAGAYLNARRYEDALAGLQRALARRSDYPLTFVFLAVCLSYLKRTEEAQTALSECERIEPGFVAEFVRWRAYKSDADNEHMRVGLLMAGANKLIRKWRRI